MKNYTNAYTQKLFKALEPLVGAIIAQSILKRIAEKIGKTEETISITDSKEIVAGIEKSLSVFLGSEAALEAARRLGEQS